MTPIPWSKIPEVVARLTEDVKKQQPLPSETCLVNQTPSGTEIIPLVPGAVTGAAAATRHPFQVRAFSDGAGGITLGVEYFSSVVTNIFQANSTQAVTGLLANGATTGTFDCPEIGGKIWLQIALTNLVEVDGTATPPVGIEYGDTGWTGYPTPYHVDSVGVPFVDTFYLLLAEVVADTDERAGTLVTVGTGETAENRKIVQLWKSHILLDWGMIDGYLVRWPVPWAAPGLVPA